MKRPPQMLNCKSLIFDIEHEGDVQAGPERRGGETGGGFGGSSVILKGGQIWKRDLNVVTPELQQGWSPQKKTREVLCGKGEALWAAKTSGKTQVLVLVVELDHGEREEKRQQEPEKKKVRTWGVENPRGFPEGGATESHYWTKTWTTQVEEWGVLKIPSYT